jgi:phthalate 4,5-dioxygenase oxygenase subunit
MVCSKSSLGDSAMLSHEDNEIVTRVGQGTPMGRTLRAYWIPAALSSEIAEPDGPPIRVRLLGEDLVAFRDTLGKIGLLDEFCPHRRVSLFFGRNEECGLRCIYHGWKFDTNGQCLEMMNEPEENDFSHKIKVTSYPTCEVGGIVWTYMGPPSQMPPPPKFAWTQALEGGIDTSHAPILHRLISETSKRGGILLRSPFVQGRAPRLVVDLTDYGYRYAGVRPLGDNEQHVRTYHFVLPFHQIRPYRSATRLEADAGHIWVPIDDETCVVYNWHYSVGAEPLTEEDRLERGNGNGPSHVDTKTFRSSANRQNNYSMDRSVQRTETFSGIDGINTQDRALQETMGRIVDRSKEHLGPADKAIIQARRLLRDAVRAVAAGEPPQGTGTSYYTLRAGEAVIPSEADWRKEVAADLPAEAILATV